MEPVVPFTLCKMAQVDGLKEKMTTMKSRRKTYNTCSVFTDEDATQWTSSKNKYKPALTPTMSLPDAQAICQLVPDPFSQALREFVDNDSDKKVALKTFWDRAVQSVANSKPVCLKVRRID